MLLTEIFMPTVSRYSHILKLIWMLSVTVVATLLCGCDNRENVVGQWQFFPEAGEMPDSLISDVTGCLVISGDGRVLLTTDVSLTSEMNDTSNHLIDSVTVKAVASIEGTWRYAPRKNNVIDIVYDYSTFGVSIDPDDISYAPAAGSVRMSVLHDTMKGTTIDEYRTRLSPALEAYFNEFVSMSGIRVDNGVMHCETIGHTYTMRAL